MFTLLYYIIIQDARNVGLRICSSFRIWWKYPWSKSRIKERVTQRVAEKTRWHIPVKNANVSSELWYVWVDTLNWKQAENIVRLHLTYITYHFFNMSRIYIDISRKIYVIMITFGYQKHFWNQKNVKSISKYVYIGYDKFDI